MPQPSQLQSLCGQFQLHGSPVRAEKIHTGHINSTWRIDCKEDGGGVRRHILQSLNREVFSAPLAVMRNVVMVTRHLSQHPGKTPRERSGTTLALVPTRDGDFWLTDSSGEVWRCYEYVENCLTHDVVTHPRLAYEAAKAFGNFLHRIADLPARKLLVTIPGFHDTRSRYHKLLRTVEMDRYGRSHSVRKEIEFIRDRAGELLDVEELVSDRGMPLRVVHNDTKVNNVMFHEASDRAHCVIDLDTVMPGLAVHDFGDLVRSCVSDSAEDERNLDQIRPRMDVFEALVDGYLEGTCDILTQVEVEHLVSGAHWMTLEVGMRFLTDHLDGDVYFRTHREHHNLDRARSQFRLLEELERLADLTRLTVSRRWQAIRNPFETVA